MADRYEEEETPLLNDHDVTVSGKARTVALSWLQISVILLSELADQISNLVLNPFLPAVRSSSSLIILRCLNPLIQLVKSLDITGGEEYKTSIRSNGRS